MVQPCYQDPTCARTRLWRRLWAAFSPLLWWAGVREGPLFCFSPRSGIVLESMAQVLPWAPSLANTMIFAPICGL